MKPYIADFVTNTSVTSFFVLGDFSTARTKKDKLYVNMKLGDKTGEIDCKIWDIPSNLDLTTLKKGMFVKAAGDVGEYLDKLQFTIRQFREVVEADAVDLGDFFECSKFDVNVMWKELLALLLLNMSEGPIKVLTCTMLTDYEFGFKRAPAAKRVHHCYLGGLLEHTLSLCRAAVKMCEHYQLSIDLMLCACVLHDMGKVKELTYEGPIGYSTQGTLIGHIPLIMDLTSRAMDDVVGFTDKMRVEVLHMIASHHGLLEWGSPKVPMLKEAIVFHFLDMIDSRLAIFDRALQTDSGGDESFTKFVSEIDGPCYKLLPEGRHEDESPF